MSLKDKKHNTVWSASVILVIKNPYILGEKNLKISYRCGSKSIFKCRICATKNVQSALSHLQKKKFIVVKNANIYFGKVCFMWFFFCSISRVGKEIEQKKEFFFHFSHIIQLCEKKNTMLSFVFAILFEINDQDHKTTYRVNSTTLVK